MGGSLASPVVGETTGSVLCRKPTARSALKVDGARAASALLASALRHMGVGSALFQMYVEADGTSLELAATPIAKPGITHGV